MNREILFKAKRKNWKELPKEQWWVEGYYRCIPCMGMLEHYIMPQISKSRVEQDAIDITTLCQFTGLTDENGKRIWENDIVRGHNNDDDLARVVFGEFNVIDVDTLETVDRAVGWHTEVIETDTLSKCEPFCLPMPLTDFYIKRSEFEVFGNIFDNAELLEAK